MVNSSLPPIPASNFLKPRGQLTNQFLFSFDFWQETACKAVIWQSLHLQKQIRPLATSDRAEAKPASKPCPGRPTMPPRGRPGQCLQKGLGQSISAEGLPPFLPNTDSDSPAAWHSPHVSHVIQLPKWELHLSCL